MNKSKELLIGTFVCLMLIVSYWGVNFLKGENLFSDKRFFYAVYDNVNGLTISRPVTVNGFKVGQVSSIKFNTQNKANLIVQISIEEDFEFSKKSILEIYDSDIMGSKSLQLKIINGDDLAASGDTLIGAIATGLTSEMSEQFGSVKVGLDQLIISFDKVLKEVKDLSNTANRILLENENKLSNSLHNVESISSVIDLQAKNINNTIDNLSQFSSSLNEIDITSLSSTISIISEDIELLLNKINNGKGSASKLLNEDSLYLEISNTIKDLDLLINDIKENPKKYINVSIWGK